MTTDRPDVLITERRVWTGLQKLVVTGLSLLLAAGTGLAGASFKVQVESVRELRDLQESDRRQNARLEAIENMGPSVTHQELTDALGKVVGMQDQMVQAFRENTQVMAEVQRTLARVEANQAADRRDIDRLFGRP